MKTMLAYLAVVLGGAGLVACLGGLVAIWVLRPTVLHSSAEVLDAADGGLKLVDAKVLRANELVRAIKEGVDPVTSKILTLADKANRTPEDEKELKRIEEALSERLRQVDTIAEVAETAVAFLNKSTRITSSLRQIGSRGASRPADTADSEKNAQALIQLAQQLKNLRENLEKFREDKQVQKEVVEAVVRIAREADDELSALDSRLQEVRQTAVEWRIEVAELHTTVPAWTNWAAVIGSVILAWLGLGQYALMRWAWHRARSYRHDVR
ncbi:MAG: hypothetical protein L0215_24280 [Gemmataceae bacterium]|nr:hypothetical protein [Gemmataceae bacterium]